MLTPQTMCKCSALLLALQFGAMPSVFAQSMHDISLTPWFYLNGGIGAESQTAMLAQRDAYNLRLTFAEAGTGAYLAGVSVSIEPVGSGSLLGPYADCGPLFYVHLQPGNYRVTASYQGSAQTRAIHIGQHAVDNVMYWPHG